MWSRASDAWQTPEVGGKVNSRKNRDELQLARRRALRAFPAVVVEEGLATDGASEFCRVDSDWEQFPVPGLVYLLLKEVLGLKPYGPFEKMVWGFEFSLRAHRYAIEFRKFGLHAQSLIGASETEAQAVERARWMLARLAKQVRASDPFFLALVEKALNSGRVTAPNLFHRLERRYRYFRKRAEDTYKLGRGRFSPEWEEAGDLTVAMLDAFFSKLEHVLVLAAPFTEAFNRIESLTRLIGERWSCKWATVLGMDDPHGKKIYDELSRVKEQYRNVFVHGGFFKGGRSLLVHTAAGAINVSFLGQGSGVHCTLDPLPEHTFREVVDLLDRAEAHLEVALPDAMQFIDSGLDVAFDAESVREYRAAMRSEDEFDRLIDRLTHLADTYANMDF